MRADDSDWSETAFALFCAALFGAIILLAAGSGALSHSWYPTECCHDKDCKPVPCDFTEESLKSPSGGSVAVVVYAEGGKKYYAEKRLIKPSPDDVCHVCLAPGTANMRCIFMPLKTT